MASRKLKVTLVLIAGTVAGCGGGGGSDGKLSIYAKDAIADSKACTDSARTQVWEVLDADNKVVAKGAKGEATHEGGVCLVRFETQEVPDGDSFVVRPTTAPGTADPKAQAISYTRKQFDEVDWTIARGDLAPLATAKTGSKKIKEITFEDQANAVCLRGDDDLVTAGEELAKASGGKAPDEAALVAFFKDKALPIARKKLDDLEKLDAGSRKKELAELVKDGREAIEEFETGLEEDGAKFLSGGASPFGDFNELARELGFDRCAGGEEPSEDASTPSTTAGASTTTTAKAG
jgi:hypothetical protein